jgi:hypothetical protein
MDAEFDLWGRFMKKLLFVCLFLASFAAALWAEKPRRYVEFGVDADISMANNHFNILDSFEQEGFDTIDVSGLSGKGVFGFGAADTRAFLNINFGEKFGLGFFVGEQATMYSHVSRDLFQYLADKNRDTQEFTASLSVGASVFMDAGVETRFRLGKLKLGIVPAVYVPLLYMPPVNVQTLVDTQKGIRADLSLELSAYTALFPDDFDDTSSSSGSQNSSKNKGEYKSPETEDQDTDFSPDIGDFLNAIDGWGLDLSVEAEYALNSRWDLGGSIRSIPLYPSTLRYGVQYQVDYRVDIREDGFVDSLAGGEDPISEEGDIFEISPEFRDDLAFRAFRPLRFDFYANYRPLGTQFIVLRPNIGFSALTVYGYDKACFNAGLEAQLNLKRIFSLSLGTGYRERIWHHDLGIMLNLRVLELVLGASLRSQDFVESFRLRGIGAHVGARLGF